MARDELETILGSDDPDPTAIGNLTLLIRSLSEQIQAIRGQAEADFEAILDDRQTRRLQAVRNAAPLCKVVPAFRALGLL